MKRIKADSIAPELKAWFVTQIQALAMRHDLIGPDIRLVNVQDYQHQLIHALRSCALAAVAAKELAFSPAEIDRCCPLLAEELIRIRQVRAASQAGELPLDKLRQLPVYAAFSDYFKETSSLVYNEVVAAARDQFNAKEDDENGEPLAPPGPLKESRSAPTREWMDFQTLGLACADDAWGAPFGTVPRDAYIAEAALRIRRNARRALRLGELQVPPQDVDQICWEAAGKSHLLRGLRAALARGELSLQDIQQMPIYGPFHQYFEEESWLIGAATQVAAAAGLPIRPPHARN